MSFAFFTIWLRQQVDQGGCFDPNPAAAGALVTDCRRNTIAIEDYLNIQQGKK